MNTEVSKIVLKNCIKSAGPVVSGVYLSKHEKNMKKFEIARDAVKIIGDTIVSAIDKTAECRIEEIRNNQNTNEILSQCDNIEKREHILENQKNYRRYMESSKKIYCGAVVAIAVIVKSALKSYWNRPRPLLKRII